MHFSLFIALRYLYSRTNLSTTRWISLISAIAIGIVTAALVAVLAVYNGYARLVLSGDKDSSPEYLLTSSNSTFFDISKIEAKLNHSPHIKHSSKILRSQGVLQSSGQNFVVDVYGIDSNYTKTVAMGEQIEQGHFIKFKPIQETPDILLGVSLASEGAVNHTDSLSTKLIFPKREGIINPLATASAFIEQEANISGVLMAYSGEVNRRVYIDIKVLQALLHHSPSMVTGLAISPKQGSSRADIEELIEIELSHGLQLLSREEQHPELTLLIKTEKVMVYFIMIFVLVLAAFNLSSSLVMLMVEKRENLKTLIALGTSSKKLAQIFSLTGIMTSGIGSGIGLVLGLGLCYLQEQFGFLSTGDGISSLPFPIEVQGLDLVYIVLCTLVVSAISALLPSLFVNKQIDIKR